jgi:uncharacterized membrane protein YfhO
MPLLIKAEIVVAKEIVVVKVAKAAVKVALLVAIIATKLLLQNSMTKSYTLTAVQKWLKVDVVLILQPSWLPVMAKVASA